MSVTCCSTQIRMKRMTNRYRFKIVRDDEPLNPRSVKHAWTFVTTCLDTEKNCKRDDPLPGGKGVFLEPLYLYRHSGDVISRKPFNDPWDSGLVGYAICPMTRFPDAESATQELDSEIEVYNQYLSGDTWGYVIEDAITDDVVDSCWSFYGEDAAVEEAEAAVELLENEFNKTMNSNHEE